MKKIVAILLVFVMTASVLTACGGGSDETKKETTNETVTNETEASGETEDNGETTAEAGDSDKLVMVTEAGFAPYEYTEDGTPKRYRGGRGLSKAILMNTPGIVAAIDDGLLNINFRVLGFETVFFDNMGNAVPEVSSGASFSTRQKDMFRRLSRGKRFYISRVRAVGPDGVERLLPTTLEVIVN